MNNLYKARAEQEGITYVDLYSLMLDERKGMKKELTTDGVHPNLEGYKILEPVLQKAIAGALNKN